MDAIAPTLPFLAMVFGAFVLGLTPLRYPLQWLETFFHELSHGMAALVTFGRVGRICIHPDGSGWCTTIGGSRFVILLAGYFGAAAWGALIYYAAWAASQSDGTAAFELLDMLLVILVVVTLLYVRHVFTFAVMVLLGGLFYSVQHGLGWTGLEGAQTLGAFANHLAEPQVWMTHTLQFIGLYVLLNAIRSPLHLIDGRMRGDGAALQRLTFMPEIFWVILWVLGGVGALAWLVWRTVLLQP